VFYYKMPTEIPAILADLSAAVYTLQHNLMQALEVNSRNKRDAENQIMSLKNRMSGFHSESYQEYKDDVKKLKKVRTDYKKNMNKRINDLEREIKGCDTNERNIRQKITNLKVKISTFRAQIEKL